MPQEIEPKTHQEQSLSMFLVQRREELGLDIEKVSDRAGISVDRIKELEEDTTSIKFIEAIELSSLFQDSIESYAGVFRAEIENPMIAELRKMEADGFVVKAYPSPHIITLTDLKYYYDMLVAVKSIDD